MFTPNENERESDFTLEWVSYLFSREICFYPAVTSEELTNATISRVSEWDVAMVVYKNFLKNILNRDGCDNHRFSLKSHDEGTFLLGNLNDNTILCRNICEYQSHPYINLKSFKFRSPWYKIFLCCIIIIITYIFPILLVTLQNMLVLFS